MELIVSSYAAEHGSCIRGRGKIPDNETFETDLWRVTGSC